MLTRVLAVVAAVAMVVGALAYRGRSKGEGPLAPTAEALRLVCATELAEACTALATEVGGLDLATEPAGTTAATLIETLSPQAARIDVWIVPRPWPAIVDEARKRANRDPILTSSAVVARSPLTAAVWPDRAEVLQKHCPTLTWKCLGESGSKPWASIGGRAEWGPVKPSHPDPTVEATGLAVVGALTVGWFGRTDLSNIDLDDDLGFSGFLSGFERAIPTPSIDPLEEMLRTNSAVTDVGIALEADNLPLLAESQRSTEPRLTYPSPVITVDVVVARVGRGRADRLAKSLGGADRLTDSLVAAGWRAPTGPAPAGAPSLPKGDGLPRPGLLDALRTRAELR